MLVKYGLPLILIVVVLAGWEYSKPSYPVNIAANAKADYGPPPPRNANEPIFQDGRRILRESTLKRLDRPWASFCQDEGRRQVASSLNEYFYHRSGQEQSYPSRWGETGKTYITREWGTTEDRRIEQQIKDMYYRGYLDPKTLDANVAKRVTAMTQGLNVTAQPCKG
jgi:hypothetical protein